MYNYTVMRQVPPRIVKFDYTEPPSTTTIAVYIYGRQDQNNKYPDNVCNSIVDPVDVKYLYRRPRTSTKTCTTTVAEDPCNGTVKFDYLRVPLLPSTILNRSENARFEGITAENDARERMHVCCMRCSWLHRFRVVIPCSSSLSCHRPVGTR